MCGRGHSSLSTRPVHVILKASGALMSKIKAFNAGTIEDVDDVFLIGLTANKMLSLSISERRCSSSRSGRCNVLPSIGTRRQQDASVIIT